MKWKPLVRNIWMMLLGILYVNFHCLSRQSLLSPETLFPQKTFLNLLHLLPLHPEATAGPVNSHGLPKSWVAQVISAISPLLWKSGRFHFSLVSLEIIRTKSFMDREVGKMSELMFSLKLIKLMDNENVQDFPVLWIWFKMKRINKHVVSPIFFCIL